MSNSKESQTQTKEERRKEEGEQELATVHECMTRRNDALKMSWQFDNLNEDLTAVNKRLKNHIHGRSIGQAINTQNVDVYQNVLQQWHRLINLKERLEKENVENHLMDTHV